MSEQKKIQLIELIQDLVNEERPHNWKKDDFVRLVDQQHATTQVDEFLGWFGGALEEI